MESRSGFEKEFQRRLEKMGKVLEGQNEERKEIERNGMEKTLEFISLLETEQIVDCVRDLTLEKKKEKIFFDWEN